LKNSIETYFVLSTNRLLDGVTLYFTETGNEHGWNLDINQATTYTEPTKDAGLALAQASYQANEVHEPYAVEITGKNEPLGARERMRAAGGPSIPYGDDAVPSKDTDYSI